MISKDVLKEISIRTGLTLQQQEKDYLLKTFLFYYYKKNNQAIFKEGTCLKYVYGLNRFSEDLDFNIKDPKTFMNETKRTLIELMNIGLKTKIIKEEEFSKAYTCEISAEGPLFNGDKRTKNKFRIDAGYRLGTIKKPEWKLIKSEYPETEENYLVLCMNQEEILAEKITAMNQRKKGRDLYDIWFLISKGVKIDFKLIKLKNKEKIKNMPSKQEYERDMKRLTSRYIEYEQIKKEVQKILQI